MTQILIPLPAYGFDPTEVAIPWKILTQAGHFVQFATPGAKVATPDQAMLDGRRLGIWKPLLRARIDAVEACALMAKSPEFQAPISYADCQEKAFDGLVLPGGHDKRVKDYLESKTLQSVVADFFTAKKPVGAICHGVVVAARSCNQETGQSVLSGYKTTCLLKSQEMLAYTMTRLWLKDYYLTYPGLTVEDEVRAALASGDDFIEGPKPMLRDSPTAMSRGFTCRDRHYLSARWPGDAYNFSQAFEGMVSGK